MSFPDRNLTLIDCVQGNARDFDITISPSSGSLTVAAVQSCTLTIRTSPDASTAIATKSLGSGITLTGTSGNNVTGLVQLSTADTSAMDAGATYVFDVVVDTTTTDQEQAAAGRIHCNPSVT